MSATEPISWWILIKNASYVGAIFLGLSIHNYGILAFFMLLDTILGVTRVGIVHGGQAIKSMRLGSGIIAKILIILIPILLAYAGKGIGLNLISVASAGISILILAHLYSILGNIHSIYLRRDVYEFDAISWALTKIQNVIEKFMKIGAPDKVMEPPPTNRDIPKP
jgi:hypothetical protein